MIVSNTLNVKEILKIYLIEQYIDQSDLTLYVSYCTVLYVRVGRGEEANKMVLSFHTIYKQNYICVGANLFDLTILNTMFIA